MQRTSRLISLATLVFVPLATLHAPPAAAGRAEDFCALLAPADFQAAGVQGARTPSINPDDQGAYCVYAGKSSATGGIEFDVFVTKDAAEAKEVYKTIRGEVGPATKVANALPGADESEIAKVTKPTAFTMIAARKGKLVFGIGVPAATTAQDAVVSLGKLVLQRGDKLSR